MSEVQNEVFESKEITGAVAKTNLTFEEFSSIVKEWEKSISDINTKILAWKTPEEIIASFEKSEEIINQITNKDLRGIYISLSKQLKVAAIDGNISKEEILAIYSNTMEDVKKFTSSLMKKNQIITDNSRDSFTNLINVLESPTNSQDSEKSSINILDTEINFDWAYNENPIDTKDNSTSSVDILGTKISFDWAYSENEKS